MTHNRTLVGTHTPTATPATGVSGRPLPTYRLCRECGTDFYPEDTPERLAVYAIAAGLRYGLCADCIADHADGCMAADYAEIGGVG